MFFWRVPRKPAYAEGQRFLKELNTKKWNIRNMHTYTDKRQERQSYGRGPVGIGGQGKCSRLKRECKI